jgi:uncharacterized protein
MKSKKLRKWLIITGIIFSGWMLTGYIFARIVTGEGKREYPALHEIGGYSASQVSFLAADHLKINAWLAGKSRDASSKKAVILLAGIRSNSVSMVARAYIYLREGYTVLIPDLRGTGKSEGDIVTFGWQERLDLLAARRFLRDQGYNEIGVHGCSLGAATIAYSLDSIRDYHFMVMESCYDNIDHALEHRTFNSGFNRALMWPAYFFVEQKTGIEADKLYPVNYVKTYTGPLLYLAGDQEIQVPLEETLTIYNSFGSDRKTLFIFPGATHCDLLNFSSKEYETELIRFLHSLNTPHER